jgi:dihydrofolate reductase
MGKIIMDMSMSLDGFIAAKNDNPDQPLGEGGMELHHWLSKDKKEVEKYYVEGNANVGVIIIGHRTYENSHTWDGKGPSDGSIPCIVLARPEHIPPKEKIGPVFTFVSSLENALARVKEIAGDKDATVMGANVQQQFIAAGLMDEIRIHVVPILLSEGVRLFEHLGSKHIALKQTEVSEGDQVAHLVYRVVKS